MRWNKFILAHWETLLLFALSALAYLPLIGQIGYTNDDWYLMYAAGVKGPGIFHEIYAVDRPLRAFVMIPAYWLFGANPLFYNLSAYFFRILSAFGFFWMMRILWPRQRVSTGLMALLFVIYPGFLSQLNGIDYQSQMVGLAAAMFSLLLTVRALSVEKVGLRILLFLLSALLGWLYLGLVEYFLGFEAVRFFLILLLAVRGGGTWLAKFTRALKLWLPSLPIAGIFLVWRIFFFHSDRGATDIGQQLGEFVLAPLTTASWWVVRMAQDVLNILFLAWGIPFGKLAFDLPLGYALAGFGLAMISVGLVWRLVRETEDGCSSHDFEWRTEAFWLGFVSIVAGLIPVILVNRHIVFPQYSRYALASSIGVVMILAALLDSIDCKSTRKGFLSLLIFTAMFTHFANNVRAAQQTAAEHYFWWQVSWRAPQFWQGTTLVANYAVGATEEDYFVWGPANLIYYPEGTHPNYVQPGIHAAILNDGTIVKVISRQRQEFDNRRSIRTYKNYRNILVLTQPSPNSCVQLVDGVQPVLSRFEKPAVRAIAAYSEADLILISDENHIPPGIAFGPEPEHGWCYYYQKASLALQAGDWEQVVFLEAQAADQGLEPFDLVEWMPFLRAHASLGNVRQFSEIAQRISADEIIRAQACHILSSQPQPNVEIEKLTQQILCGPNP
jgi:hypothetical protein